MVKSTNMNRLFIPQRLVKPLTKKQPKWVALPNFMAYADLQMKKEKQSPMALLTVQRNSVCFIMKRFLVPQPYITMSILV
ncbi:hypothetical protein D358_00602 [Enterococcus faecalis RP2S-4]|uniref:Uncharacterized protein n=1 Tax=Enterococcus faecalis RP2S-4 TaxID=1244145 RepID=A0ABC9TNC9_ENTFL|nr:hypothetical protein D358_00602 [Enterococcus faecalis RP2S-4]